MIVSSLTPQIVTRSDALSAYVDYAFYSLRQHTEDLQKIRNKDLITALKKTAFCCHNPRSAEM